MRLLFAGSPAPAARALAALLASRHEVVAVLTRPDAPAGRGRATSPSAVAAAARDAGLEVLAPTTLSEPAFRSRLAELAVDVAPVVAYGALIPADLLDVPTHGWVNLHFSVLPAWRGAAPVQHAVLAGDEVTGASTFRIEAGLDTGPVFGTVTEPIGAQDTTGDLLDRLAGIGSQLLVRTLDALEDGILAAVPQPADGVSYAPKLTTDDGRVRWEHPAHLVDRRIRACTPAPGAWTTVHGARLGLGPVRPAPEAEPLAAGHVRVGRREVVVGTGGFPVVLGTVTPAGRRPMAAADWARGARLGDDAVLGVVA
ncbi:MAG: methionyl-tRNA formyltransferase [Cellulomonas sp.]|nr:methionyl-tRNA formyltransferase [Cellulomonas sp.]